MVHMKVDNLMPKNKDITHCLQFDIGYLDELCINKIHLRYSGGLRFLTIKTVQ